MSLTKRFFYDKIVERNTDKSLHQLSQYDKLQQEFLNEKINENQNKEEPLLTLALKKEYRFKI